MNNIEKLYSQMSGAFLTEYIPEELLQGDDQSWDAIDAFIDEHMIDVFASRGVPPNEVWNMIGDASRVAIKFHNSIINWG